MASNDTMAKQMVYGLLVVAAILGALGGYMVAPEKTVEVEVEVPIEVPVEVEKIVVEYASLTDLAEGIRSGDVDVGDDYSMDLEGRYHVIHADELELSCFSCHVGDEYTMETQYQRADKTSVMEPAGVVDRGMCLGCHREEGIAHELYGSEGN